MTPDFSKKERKKYRSLPIKTIVVELVKQRAEMIEEIRGKWFYLFLSITVVRVQIKVGLIVSYFQY